MKIDCCVLIKIFFLVSIHLDSSPRTLGKTLAFIQSMLNGQEYEEHHDDASDESLFTTSDFVNGVTRYYDIFVSFR